VNKLGHYCANTSNNSLMGELFKEKNIFQITLTFAPRVSYVSPGAPSSSREQLRRL
jgi:hypothetical protein